MNSKYAVLVCFLVLAFAFNGVNAYCNPDDCWGLCRSQYGGAYAKTRGVCESSNNDYCRCYGLCQASSNWLSYGFRDVNQLKNAQDIVLNIYISSTRKLQK
ncbi:uncharacterized protein LOC126839489 [Adelges cooleyi]|uniref:uncharacterized protein LOC126839489 n=1 Tax=Adelges cooleyi TaxID=133065 RepID=UPI00217F7790|nr:uncharacterized protein LOC126839489 [Adelges cooleyi]